MFHVLNVLTCTFLTLLCVGAHAISTWCNWCANREVLLYVLVLTWCCRTGCVGCSLCRLASLVAPKWHSALCYS